MAIPWVAIPGAGITLSKPPPESGRGREVVDRGGGRRGLLRQKLSGVFFFLAPDSPGQEPLLAGDQRHPDLGQLLLSETRVEG